jgi:hypothetical protein
VAFAAAALVACGSSGSSSPGGPGGGQTCALSVTLSGAVNATAGNDVGCGNVSGTTGASLDWSASGCLVHSQGPCFNLAVDLASPIAGGQTGAINVTDVRVNTFDGDGGSETWETPPGACTLSIASNTSNPDASGVFKNRYEISGSGNCAQPAAPQGSASGGDVTIGAFTFSGFIDPS